MRRRRRPTPCSPGTQPAGAVTFTPDAARAGLYTLEAIYGRSTLQQAIDAKATVPPVTFTFSMKR